ncbi:MBL fold metallo-hydrolase [Stappia sp. BW2]|uniref:MBL fold metallo-hydrolase n=1 Tax=Stappia sp. BW2 TaxID=2592622 RepID=UPI0013968934|nr:MBL fold metallo-hydrolase [Stappia sp. BW2]
MLWTSEPTKEDGKPNFNSRIIGRLVQGAVLECNVNDNCPQRVSLAYSASQFKSRSPDVKSFPVQSWDCLADIDTWILDCDYWEPSESHGDPETVLKLVDQLKPRQVFLTHMDEKMDYLVLKSWFVDRGYAHVAPAYDGLTIESSST